MSLGTIVLIIIVLMLLGHTAKVGAMVQAEVWVWY